MSVNIDEITSLWNKNWFMRKNIFVIKNNMYHGEYSINHSEQYAEDMMRFLQEIL